MNKKRKEILPLSILLKLKKIRVQDLPISNPTYWAMVNGTKKTWRQNILKVADALNITEGELKKSIELEQNLRK